MKLSNMLFVLGGLILGVGSFVWGILNGTTVGSALGQITGTMIGYGVVWFIYSRLEFQVNKYLQKRSVQKRQGDKK